MILSIQPLQDLDGHHQYMLTLVVQEILAHLF